jgi:hypothetical protein
VLLEGVRDERVGAVCGFQMGHDVFLVGSGAGRTRCAAGFEFIGLGAGPGGQRRRAALPCSVPATSSSATPKEGGAGSGPMTRADPQGPPGPRLIQWPLSMDSVVS